MSASAVASTSAAPIPATVEDKRANHLDISALSPQEYSTFPQWLRGIKPARSGAADHVDEEDCLRFLREECGIAVEEEVKILSMFERFPLGLLPGHFFALLRLAAWVQRGQPPSKATLFSQAPPPAIGGTRKRRPTSISMASPPRVVSGSTAPDMSTSPASRAPEVPPKPPMKAVPPPPPPPHAVASPPRALPPSAPLVPLVGANHEPTAAQALEEVVKSTPAPNPFRGHTPSNSFSAMPPIAAGIRPFDPAPNPFKQSKPKLVRPTPVVADANHPVLVGAMMNPFKPVGTLKRTDGEGAAESAQSSPASERSGLDFGIPAVPARPGEKPPPPLPPRQANPLIQAGLAARESVRKQQESLPPKTYTVLQSSGSAAPKVPRLLDGKPPPPGVPLPPPTHHAKRKTTGGFDPRRSISESVHPGLSHRHSGSNQGDEQGIPMASGSRRGGSEKHMRAVSGGVLASSTAKGAVGSLPPAIAPKPHYGSIGKGKSSVPSWLKEQEELQRTGATEGPSRPSSTAFRHASHMSHASHNSSSKPSSRAEFLDNDDDEAFSEVARSAASIDRNNPFFLRSARDAEKAPTQQPPEPLTRMAVARAAAAARRASGDTEMDLETMHAKSQNGGRAPSDGTEGILGGLARSKTMGGVRTIPPPAPPRRKPDLYSATFDSGTFAGFRHSSRPEGKLSGGLRLTPTPQRADVGLPARVLAERERIEREKMERLAATIVEAQAESEQEQQRIIEEHEAAIGSPTSELPPPPIRRASSVSYPVVGHRESFAETARNGTSLTERAKELLGLSASGAPPAALKGNRPLDQLKQDFVAVAERHEWLARATERATGRPLNEATTALMEDEREGDDAPDVDDGYEEERRKEREAAAAAAAGRDGVDDDALMRRSSSRHGSIGAAVGLRRTSSRRSTAGLEGPFADAKSPTAPSTATLDGSALAIDEDEVRPDTDTRENGWQQLS